MNLNDLKTDGSMGTSKRYGMIVDLNRCVGCQTCTIACKHSNDTRNAPRIIGERPHKAPTRHNNKATTQAPRKDQHATSAHMRTPTTQRPLR